MRTNSGAMEIGDNRIDADSRARWTPCWPIPTRVQESTVLLIWPSPSPSSWHPIIDQSWSRAGREHRVEYRACKVHDRRQTCDDCDQLWGLLAIPAIGVTISIIITASHFQIGLHLPLPSPGGPSPAVGRCPRFDQRSHQRIFSEAKAILLTGAHPTAAISFDPLRLLMSLFPEDERLADRTANPSPVTWRVPAANHGPGETEIESSLSSRENQI